jgi:tetratricopeptide (TPR) repeat protein
VIVRPVGVAAYVPFLSGFRRRSLKKLEHLGDAAVDAQRYHEAISYYSTSLSLNSPSPQGILIKRSKARMATGSWKQAVDDANQVHRFTPRRPVLFTRRHQVITLDPLSPWGYEIKYAALHEAGDFDNAIDVLETMLSMIAHSPDPDIRRESYPRYQDKDDSFTLFDRAWRPVR